MFRSFRFLCIITLLAIGIGCTEQVKRDPMQAFPYHANRFDIAFAWEAHPTPGGLEVSGIAKNVRYPYLEGLQLQLSLLDRDNKVLAREMYLFVPDTLAQDDTTTFHATLKSTTPPGAKLTFNYRYLVNDSNDSFRWTSIFTADAATGEVFREE